MRTPLLFSALFLALTGTVFAQTEKGRWLVGGGGTGYFDTSNDNFKQTFVLLAPGAGYFVANNVTIGASLPLLHFRSKGGGFEGHSTTAGFTPFARFYFGKANVKPYLQGQFGFLTSTSKSSGSFGTPSSSSSGTFTYGGAAGLAFFLNEHSSLDVSLNYTGGSRDNETGGIFVLGAYPRTLTLNVGFQLFLGKAK